MCLCVSSHYIGLFDVILIQRRKLDGLCGNARDDDFSLHVLTLYAAFFFVGFVTIIILLYDRVSQGVPLLSDKLYSSK